MAVAPEFERAGLLSTNTPSGERFQDGSGVLLPAQEWLTENSPRSAFAENIEPRQI
jgi:hypothetical protein